MMFPNIRAVDARLLLASLTTHTSDVDDERPPICATCGVTMVPAALSAREERDGDWICLECEETIEPNMT
jgi:hypothetical protein